MRLNSGRGAKLLKLAYLLVTFALLFDIVILNIDGSWSGFTRLSPIALAVLAFLWYRGLPEFLYDSDGEVLNLTAQDPNLMWISRRLFYKHTEFPKRKLEGFRIMKYPLRRVVLKIKSKDGSTKKEKFSASYLSGREMHDLSRSLRNVIEQNKKENG